MGLCILEVLQGTITGAAAGFTAGASLLATTAVSAGANVAGGVANRSIQSKGTSLTEAAIDAGVGAAFGAAEKMVSQGISKLSSQATNQVTAQLKGVAVAQVNVAVKGVQYSDDLVKATQQLYPKTSGILRDAVKGKGNYGLGSGTYDEAMQAGRFWVGDGFTISKDGSSWISSDGLRQFRPPSFKPKLNIE